MAKRLIQRILLLSALAVLIIGLLLYNDQKAYSGTAAKFKRNYNKKSFKPFAKLELSFNPGEILDIINGDTLLINSRDGKKLYWVDLKNNITVEYSPPNIGDNFDRITMACYKNNTLLVLNGNGKTLLKNSQFPFAAEQPGIDTFGYAIINGMPLAGNQLVMKKMMDDGFSCKLITYNILTRIYQEEKVPGTQQMDCLATDNCFAYDGKNGIYFINLYNSKVTRFDTSLNRVYEKHTIDKVYDLPLVKYDTLNKSQNFISPHRIINYCAAADTQHLFVLSAASAVNDLRSSFINHNPIDLYNTNTGDYEESFHLEGVNINAVKGLSISNNILFIVIDRYLYMYNYKKTLYEQ